MVAQERPDKFAFSCYGTVHILPSLLLVCVSLPSLLSVQRSYPVFLCNTGCSEHSAFHIASTQAEAYGIKVNIANVFFF